LNRCAVTSGFFVLGRCGQAAVAPCGRCGRPVCQEHYGLGGLCPGCRATAAHPSEDPYENEWAWGYRHGFYARSAQTYQDPTWYSNFDAYDRGAFDPGQGHSPDDHDYGSGDGSGFVDS
jgi:hypothetical protein